jgi:ribonuclease E
MGTGGADRGADEELFDDDVDTDRAMTSDDLAVDARVDAGLAPAPAGATRPPLASRPRIGDTRPAPAVPSGSGRDAPADGGGSGSSRRRRRGGRGRKRPGSGGPASPSPSGTTFDDVVYADLGTGEASSFEELDETTLARRRGRTRKGRPAGRYQMCVHVRPDGHTHLALLEGRVLIEHSVSTPRDQDTSIDGNIYLGRVQNVLPGMEAAFIDIGTPKNGVLYRGDVMFDPADVESKQPAIEQLLKNGQSVIVQVTKNPIGAKGARLTQEVSLAGRFVVMVPGQPNTYGISKRLPDDERKRLRKILEEVRPPDVGLIVRTAAEGATADELQRDVRRLGEQWAQISSLAERSKPGRLLYQEPPLTLRLLREEFNKEYRSVMIDDHALYEEARGYIEAISPELADRVEFYDEAEEGLPVFERFHVQEQLLKALDRKVWLPSGGSLVIERTEALTVIDVNTGKNVGKSNLEATVFANNLEAADEIARQLRLRDIGGIIVIDFIDMEIKANRATVGNVLRDALARDKTRTQVFDISELGLVEMTRKRVSEGLVESVSETCPTCAGRGYLLDEALLEELR